MGGRGGAWGSVGGFAEGEPGRLRTWYAPTAAAGRQIASRTATRLKCIAHKYLAERRGSTDRLPAMCKSIHTLYNFEPPATPDEVRSASLQYVRKISGFPKPSQANAEAFERAVDAVAAASERLLGELVTSAPPKDREVEAAKARARWAERQAV